MKELADKVAVVTGGGSGIGRGTALAAAGTHVVVAEVSRERAEAVAEEATATGADSIGVRVAARSDADFASLKDTRLVRFGRIDVVVNNVGLIAAAFPTRAPWRSGSGSSTPT